MFLHVNFIEFRSFHKGNLLHDFHFRELELRNFGKDGIVHRNVGCRIVSEQGAEFDAGVLIVENITGQPSFHFDEPAGVIFLASLSRLIRV